MTSIKKTDSPHVMPHHDDDVDLERIKQEVLEQRIRKAQKLASRIKTLPDGSRLFRRFDRSQRYQHLVLLSSFTLLAFTGLLQTFSGYAVIAAFINMLGGVEGLRTIHRLAAIALILVSVYHVWRILETWFVKRERGGMWPQIKDFKDLFHMILYNVDKAPEPPKFDRFSIEEKIEYWALLWGQVLMIVTGLVMWFPILITQVLPGTAIPISRSLHHWEAILAVLSILIWHMYHTQIKTRNLSIFTGYMTEEEVLDEHPLEYERIMAAHEFLQRVKAGVEGQHPGLIPSEDGGSDAALTSPLVAPR
jgi:cytochrome b subunit of formate dehydrogenase